MKVILILVAVFLLASCNDVSRPMVDSEEEIEYTPGIWNPADRTPPYIVGEIDSFIREDDINSNEFVVTYIN
jgi:hypothetical protein